MIQIGKTIVGAEFVDGVVLGAEILFPDDLFKTRGVVLHLLLLRIIIMWGFDDEQLSEGN